MSKPALPAPSADFLIRNRSDDATAFSVLMVPSDMDIPDKILSYVYENWSV
jgi:hypothetical protein